MHEVYLALGSNLGDRHAILDEAIVLIGRSIGRVQAVSRRYETEPEGFSSSHLFVNVALAVETNLSPEALLDATQQIEVSLGRTTKSVHGSYADRTIDIDILLYDDLCYETPRLTIPHPRMACRRFVLEPLCDLIGARELTLLGHKTPKQLLERLERGQAHYYISPSLDPFYNIALEDFLYRELRSYDHLYMLWINAPSVFMGRYQAAMAETDLTYLSERGIPLLRRTSGGGTVYHDEGNLNFTCIRTDRTRGGFDLKSFPQPVMSALRSLGVQVELSPRGDLRCGAFKIGGSAEATRQGRMLYHMCLLFDADLDALTHALNAPSDASVVSRVPSVRSRVCNIRSLLREDMTLAAFRDLLVEHIAYECTELLPLSLPEDANAYISHQRQALFESPEWIHSPIGTKKR